MPIDVCRRGTREGGEDDVRAAGIVASLLERVSHQVVDAGDDLGLAGSSASVNHNQWCRGFGEVLIRGGQREGDNPLGIVDCNGECFLLSRVQLPCFFNLTEKNTLKKAVYV